MYYMEEIMNILDIGVDIIEIDRIKKIVDKNEKFLKNSNIVIPAEKFDNPESYTYMFLNSF